MIVRLQHVGLAVRSMEETCKTFERLFGLKCQGLRNDQGKGMQLDCRILLPNRCWLHIVQNWNPESRVNRHLKQKGPGVEHIALESDDIEADVQRVKDAGAPIFQDKIFNAPDGFEAFVYPEHTTGVTVELIQPHDTSWAFQICRRSERNVLGLQHIGLAVRDLEKTCKIFKELFGLRCQDLRTDQHGGTQKDAMIPLGNDRLWLHVVESWARDNRVYQHLEEHGEGLEHIAIEVNNVKDAVDRVKAAGIPIYQDRIYTDRDDGLEAFVYPEYTTGAAVELIQPHPWSRGYRPRVLEVAP